MTPLYRDFVSQEQLDREYDVESIHPDFGGVVEQFLGLSEAARGQATARFDVPFGPTRDEYVDIYPAEGDAGRPVLMFIHGGFWRILSAKEFALVAPGPVARGVDVVVTNYSLAPKVTLEEITRQSRAAVAWVHANAASWGGDPERIFVAGHSAGGQQVALLRHTDWAGEYGLPADVIKGVVPISGLFDLRPLPYSFVAPALQLSRRTVETQSPQLLAPCPGPPMLVSWGDAETAEFRRQSVDYLASSTEAGLDADGLPLPGDDHFAAVMELNDPHSTLTDAVLAFMERCT